jgi:hypothetical protein
MLFGIINNKGDKIMTRAHFVKKAQKAYPKEGIKKGDSYWWWAFAFGPKYKSKTQPTRSQLTQSAFFGTLYAIEDGMSKVFEKMTSSEDIQSAKEETIGEIENLKDETQSSLDNMPEQLQESSPNQERIDGLENWLSDLESIDTDIDDDLTDEEKADRAEEIIGEICGTSSGL